MCTKGCITNMALELSATGKVPTLPGGTPGLRLQLERGAIVEFEDANGQCHLNRTIVNRNY